MVMDLLGAIIRTNLQIWKVVEPQFPVEIRTPADAAAASARALSPWICPEQLSEFKERPVL